MENKLIRSLLPGYGVMVDVGANYGTSHAPFIGWQIYAFEPDPDNRKHIPRHDCVTIDERALSDKPIASAPFYRTPETHEMSSLLNFKESHEYAFDVEVTTLKIALAEYGVTHVDYLKIDAEGYDFYVLKGFPFEQMRPQVMMCEFCDGRTKRLNFTKDDVARFMMDKGYKIVMSEWDNAKMVDGRVHHDWLRYCRYPCKGYRLSWGNMIAFRDDYLYKRMLEKCGI